MIEAGQRAIVDRESEPAARRQTESNGDCRTYRSAMRNSHNVAALVGLDHARYCGADSDNEIGEAFAVRRAFVRSRIPERVRLLLAVHQKRVAIESLPISEMLLGEVFVLLNFLRRLEIPGRQNRSRGLMRSRQMAGDPNSLSRQKRRETGKDARIAAIAGQIRLAVNAAFVHADRCVANPPPACAHESVLSSLARHDLVQCCGFGQTSLPAPVGCSDYGQRFPDSSANAKTRFL